MKEDMFGLAKAYEQLEDLVDSGVAPDEVTDRELAAHLQVVHQLQAEAGSSDMPRPMEFRNQVIGRIRNRPARHRWFYLAAAAAAILGLIFSPLGQNQDEPRIVFDKNALARVEDNRLQDEMVSYLEHTERLLVFMRDHELSCSEETRDMAPEKELAKSLLYKQQHFAPDMSLPQYVQARDLFAQLENILVDVNSLDACTDPTEIEFINDQISKKRILSKLGLIAQDIRLS